MHLLEHKGKDILEKSKINIPKSILIDKSLKGYKKFFNKHKKVIIKAQVIEGKRKKQGLIIESNNYEKSLKLISKLFNKKIKALLIEEFLTIEKEYFLSIVYDTKTRGIIILLSDDGGIDIESGKEPIITTIEEVDNLDLKELIPLIKNAYSCFEKYDCTNLEINPIIKTSNGLYAGDAKIIIDDAALGRQDEFKDLKEHESFLTELEIKARSIDKDDYRGVAGKTFVELDGNIAVLASGGGASLTCMDALIEAGGKPANYTEYSGNPTREKVRKLTEITLSKKNLKGCLVIGGRANFTDIFETLSGFAEAIIKIKPKYPIVIRRAGPNADKAFEMLKKVSKEHNLDITLYGEEMPLTKAVKIMVEKVNVN